MILKGGTAINLTVFNLPRLSVDITFAKVKRDLFPVIAKKDNFDLEQRKESAKLFIRELMVLTDNEKEFLDRFEKKEFRPELVFEDEKIIARLENHPMAIWKMGQ